MRIKIGRFHTGLIEYAFSWKWFSVLENEQVSWIDCFINWVFLSFLSKKELCCYSNKAWKNIVKMLFWILFVFYLKCWSRLRSCSCCRCDLSLLTDQGRVGSVFRRRDSSEFCRTSFWRQLDPQVRGAQRVFLRLDDDNLWDVLLRSVDGVRLTSRRRRCWSRCRCRCWWSWKGSRSLGVGRLSVMAGERISRAERK